MMSITVTKRHYVGSPSKRIGNTSKYLQEIPLVGYWPKTSDTGATYGVSLYYDNGNHYANMYGIVDYSSAKVEIDTVSTENTLLYSSTGYYENEQYKNISFFIKTSNDNCLYVPLSMHEGSQAYSNTVYIYSGYLDTKSTSSSESLETFTESLAFKTTSPEGYVSLCPLINGSGEWSEKGAPTELSLVSGIDNASWDMNGIRVGNKTLFGYDGICIAADVVVDGGTINTSEAS